MEGAVDDDHVAAGPALRASLIAASLASAPELQKNTLPPRLRPHSRSARRIAGSV